jgi:hypothetical protein
MRLRLSIVLPAIQCGLEAVLLHGGVYLTPSASKLTDAYYPSFGGRASFALSLNPPAAIVVVPLYNLVSWLWSFVSPRRVGPAGFEVIFLGCVLVTWFLIGSWLDRRGTAEKPAQPPKPTLTGFLWRLVPLGAGLFFVAVFGLYQGFFRGHGLSWPHPHWANLYFLRWEWHSLDEIIWLSMFRTWGVFLIGAPSITFIRWVRESKRRGAAHELHEGLLSSPLSNSRWFLIAAGLFATMFLGTVIFGR